MSRLTRLAPGLNAFTFRFEGSVLDEVRASYTNEIAPFIGHPDNRSLLAGGVGYRRPLPSAPERYLIVSYGTHPLLWISNNNAETHRLFRRCFRSLRIEEEVGRLVDCRRGVVMYCGFLVIGNRAVEPNWHVDYAPGANAYTLITPLIELDPDHGNLLYESGSKEVHTYRYAPNEAVILGERFRHSTEPYGPSGKLRVLLSMTFGTDRIEYWHLLRQTIETQSDYLLLPCGHRNGACRCPEQARDRPRKIGRNDPCHCGSGKKFKHCHGR